MSSGEKSNCDDVCCGSMLRAHSWTPETSEEQLLASADSAEAAGTVLPAVPRSVVVTG